MAIALMEIAKSEDVFQTLGMPPRQEHNSLEDIMYTLLSVKRMKELFFKGIEAEFSAWLKKILRPFLAALEQSSPHTTALHEWKEAYWYDLRSKAIGPNLQISDQSRIQINSVLFTFNRKCVKIALY